MNKLPGKVVTLAAARRQTYDQRWRRAGSPFAARIQSDSDRLACHWQHDPVSHRLHCIWRVCDALEDEPRLRLAG